MVTTSEDRRADHRGPPEFCHPARAAARRLRELTAEIASAFDPTRLVPLEAKETLEDLTAGFKYPRGRSPSRSRRQANSLFAGGTLKLTSPLKIMARLLVGA